MTPSRSGRRRRAPWIGVLAVGTLLLPFAARAASEDSPDGTTYTLVNACASQVLEVGPEGSGPGPELRAATADGGDGQQWRVEDAGGGFSFLVSVADDRVVDAAYAGATAGTSLITYAKHGGANQQWRLADAGEGRHTIEARHAPGLLVGLTSGSARLMSASGCDTRWTLQPVPTDADPSPSPTPTPTASSSPSPSASSGGATGSHGGRLVNPMPGMNGLGETLTIPQGHPGYADSRVRQTQFEVPKAGEDVGAFRVSCEYSHMAFDDPIVKPGQPGKSHLHTFFGNTLATGDSTPDSIATTGSSTCHGGTANRSAYWVPTLFDSRTGQPIKPTFAIMYYKTGYEGVKAEDVRRMPERLRVVAGDAAASSKQDRMIWGCLVGGGPNPGGGIPTDCGVGAEAVQMSVVFPQCWDGQNLDSADHKSHMSYPDNPNGCPASHPVPLSQITINVRYAVTSEGESRFWKLSSDMYDTTDKPAGLSLHGDWMNGWDDDVAQAWVEGCLHPRRSCSYQMGDGRELYAD